MRYPNRAPTGVCMTQQVDAGHALSTVSSTASTADCERSEPHSRLRDGGEP